MQSAGNNFRRDGRLHGSHVYFFQCQGDTVEHIYIKIGISDFPTDRLHALWTNCVVKPISFGLIHVYSRIIAKKIESELHKAFRPWRVRGEWFCFNPSEKEVFAAKREEIIRKYRRESWPMQVEMVNVVALMRDAQKKATFYKKRILPKGLRRA